VEKGEHILVDNYFLKHSKVEMPVAGIIKQSLGMNAYMEIEELRDILFEDDLITGVFVDSDDDMFFEKLIKATNVASVMSSEDVKNIYKEYMGFIFLSIGFMLIFSGVIGFGIVYVSTMISIGEREGEFSSLRVLGFTKKEILES
jgi:putative ABC transport system permease protein